MIEQFLNQAAIQLEQLNQFYVEVKQSNQQILATNNELQQSNQIQDKASYEVALIQERLKLSQLDIVEQSKGLNQLKIDVDQIQNTLLDNMKNMQINRFVTQADGNTDVFNSTLWLQELEQQVMCFDQASEKLASLSIDLTPVEKTCVLAEEQSRQVIEELAILTEQIQVLNETLQVNISLRVTIFVSLGYTDKNTQSTDYIREFVKKSNQVLNDELFKLQKAQQESEARLQQLLGEEKRAKQQLSDVNEEIIKVEILIQISVEKSQNDLMQLQNLELIDIESQLQTLTNKLKQTQFQIGQLQQSINADHQNKIKQQGLLSQIENEQNALDDLAYLTRLIGSADGAKFRKFAQGLTLNHLVYLANEQLNKLDGRYQLQCQQSDTLSLSVLDTWQGDSIRDTKTLSGGESFLVSLALALALSDLVSSKTSIDSLFLDEGFGTLDNDTLEIALDALDNLNASGKMIGIISHVDALKERIGVQIKVEKQSGLGVSLLDKQFSA
jgi:exonuclease SbcC